MKTSTLLLVLAVIAALQHRLRASPVHDDDLAPHFEIAGAKPGQDVFPMKSTSTRVSIAGVIADVEVTQTYANTGSQPLEALYVFPGSTHAAVHGMEIKVGERVLKAEIQEKGQARQTYEKAKTEKKVASLLEQKRPNVFQMNVANIAVGAEVQVQLHYSEQLVPVERVYEFALPGVVGPRYTVGGSGETWQNNPFLKEGAPAPTTLDFALHLDAGLPIKSLTSPSHAMAIKFLNSTMADVTLKPDAEGGAALNRDLVVRYQLADQKINSGLLLHRGEDENFFLLNVQPPERVTMDEVPGRDYLFVVDVSGSMMGFPLDVSKKLMGSLLHGLRSKDKFNVLLFAGGSSVMSEAPLVASANNIAFAEKMLGEQSGGGCTQLLPALQRALAMPGEDDRARSIVVITDGFIDVEREAFELVRRNLNQASLFAVGIGSSVNRHLIEGLAHVGNGEPFFVMQPRECEATTKRFLSYVSSPLLTDIHVRAEGFDAYDLEPASVPVLFADRPLSIVGKWRGEPTGKLIVTGRTAKGPYEASVDVGWTAKGSVANPALRPLWARERVRVLGDYAWLRRDAASDVTDSKALTALGLRYSLLTENTSFVAVDTQAQPLLASATSVVQPLPLPQGVSNHAVGTAAGAVPEPGSSGLAFLGLAALLMRRRRTLGAEQTTLN